MADTKPRRHSWSKPVNGARECGQCGTVARRGSVPCGMPKAVEYHRAGQRMVSEHVPPCGEWEHQTAGPDELAALADQADHAAGVAYKSGDLERASRLIADARVLDPSRADLWASRDSRLRSAASREVRHLPLGDQVNARLRAAGFTPESPEIRQIASWNARAHEREAG